MTHLLSRTTAYLTAAAALATAAPTLAQASYTQGFDDLAGGLAALTAQGYQFRDQTIASGPPWWNAAFEVTSGFGGQPPQSGAGFLYYTGTTNAQGSATVSAWAILPAIPNQAAGDVLSFWYRGAGFNEGPFSSPGSVEVRYSPAGGTGTGTTPASVGDFTTLVTSFVPVENAPYTQLSVPVPGPGRLAVRILGAVTVFEYGPALQLDSLSFNPGAPPFPVPQPGQAVTWTAAMSPITLTADVTIPAGAIVNVDPGVEIRIGADRTLHVVGRLVASGTLAAPVRITQLGAVGEVAPFTGGLLDLSHVTVDAHIHPRTGAVLRARDCTFTSRGSIVNAFDTLADPTHSVLRLEGCTFQGSTVQMHKVMASLEGVAFLQLSQFTDVLLLGYVKLDDVALDGSALWLGKDIAAQPVFVDDVTVRNSALHGGLYLSRSTNFLLGPGNVLQNNRWPVEFGAGGAGLLAGSVVPTSGNVDDYVVDTDDNDPGGRVVWGALAVPYVVRTSRFVGRHDILPGARVQFMPGLGWTSDGFGRLEARGTEAAPIVFEPRIPGLPWAGLDFTNPTASQRLEHCVLRGGTKGAGGALHIDSCLFEQNATGLVSGEHDWVIVRGSRFVGNAVGIDAAIGSPFFDGAILCESPEDPNSFTGNTLAIEASNNNIPNAARSNWWGHPSGPFHPVLNPSGLGDPVLVLNGGALPFQPVLTAPPDFTDSPPEVAWLDGRDLALEPGATHLLTFRASDDGQLASHRLWFSPNGSAPGSFQLLGTFGPEVRTVPFTVPQIGTQINGQLAFLRIESIDDQGQVGFDDLDLFISDPSLAGTVTLTTNVTGAHTPGDHFEVTFTTSGVSPVVSPSVRGYLLLDNDGESFALGAGTYSLNQLPGGLTMPEVSTDRARLGLLLQGTLNQARWHFSEPFAIRPHALIGDAAPTVTMTAPAAGAVFPGGGWMPVRWLAQDDEGLRSFDVQVSTDDGRTWMVAARDLPGSARGFDWRLPASVGVAALRVRVIAHDSRFQNSSDGDQRVVRIDPSGPGLAYCTPQPNSTGATGVVFGQGSRRVVDNDLRLTALRLPGNATGYLLNAPQQGNAPFPGGSAGVLCLGGPVGRHLAQVGNTGSTGLLSVQVNLTALPRPSGPVSVQVGQTWHFQFWHRDSVQGAPTSNFTEGYSVTFE